MKANSYRTVTNEPETITIEKLVYGGKGLGRLDGRVVLAPFVLPGETARVRVEARKAGFVEAGLEEVVTAAPGRVEPPCPFFYRCGGCHYQHASYEVQLEQKREIVREALARLGKLEPPDAGIVSGPPWYYRNRTQLHISGGEIGYYAHGSRRLVPVDRCPISSPKINEALAALAGMLRDARFPAFVSCIELFTNESEVQLNVVESSRPVARRFFDWCAERIPGFTHDAVEYAAGGFLFRVRRRSFFQVNRFLIDPLVETALAGAEGQTALDLYAGVGLFTLPLARRFKNVTAVESSSSAAGDLEFNAARAAAAAEVRRQPVETFLEQVTQTPDFVLADPPRTGLGKPAVSQLLRLRPPRMAIVSCDPATLARDLGALVSGGYQINRLTVLDLFPQTYHIETVTQLSLSEPG
ncbi:MAG: class I SAM-dependent RNA methyltransferase [Rhodospirillales bacterium]